jgi:adenylate cyclase class 2
MIEVEFKAWVDDLEAFEAIVRAHAAFAGEVLKHDIYFRQPDRPALYFRLRREGDRAIVTTKDKRIADGIETSDEVEFEVSDPQAFCRLAERFGFEPFVVKRKATRRYRAGATDIELSEVAHLGFFVEIEILCENDTEVEAARRELAGWAERLGISPEAIEPRLYIHLLAERHPARYTFDHGDPDSLVREEPLSGAGRQERLL